MWICSWTKESAQYRIILWFTPCNCLRTKRCTWSILFDSTLYCTLCILVCELRFNSEWLVGFLWIMPPFFSAYTPFLWALSLDDHSPWIRKKKADSCNYSFSESLWYNSFTRNVILLVLTAVLKSVPHFATHNISHCVCLNVHTHLFTKAVLSFCWCISHLTLTTHEKCSLENSRPLVHLDTILFKYLWWSKASHTPSVVVVKFPLSWK